MSLSIQYTVHKTTIPLLSGTDVKFSQRNNPYCDFSFQIKALMIFDTLKYNNKYT